VERRTESLSLLTSAAAGKWTFTPSRGVFAHDKLTGSTSTVRVTSSDRFRLGSSSPRRRQSVAKRRILFPPSPQIQPGIARPVHHRAKSSWTAAAPCRYRPGGRGYLTAHPRHPTPRRRRTSALQVAGAQCGSTRDSEFVEMRVAGESRIGDSEMSGVRQIAISETPSRKSVRANRPC
jgi:hypothetical protein